MTAACPFRPSRLLQSGRSAKPRSFELGCSEAVSKGLPVNPARFLVRPLGRFVFVDQDVSMSMFVLVVLFMDCVAGSSVVLDRNRADCHPSNRPCSAHACAGPCNKPLRWASVIGRHDPGSEDQSLPVNGRRRQLSRLSTGRSDLWCLALHSCSRSRSVSK